MIDTPEKPAVPRESLAARLWPSGERCCGEPVMPKDTFFAYYGDPGPVSAHLQQLAIHRARHAATELVLAHLQNERDRLGRDLMGLAEIAALFGVSTQRINELHRHTAGFPAPVAYPKMGPVFDRVDIEAYRRCTPARPGGRPRRW